MGLNALQINRAAKVYTFARTANMDSGGIETTDQERVVTAAVEFAERELAKLGFDPGEVASLQDVIKRVSAT